MNGLRLQNASRRISTFRIVYGFHPHNTISLRCRKQSLFASHICGIQCLFSNHQKSIRSAFYRDSAKGAVLSNHEFPSTSNSTKIHTWRIHQYSCATGRQISSWGSATTRIWETIRHKSSWSRSQRWASQSSIAPSSASSCITTHPAGCENHKRDSAERC